MKSEQRYFDNIVSNLSDAELSQSFKDRLAMMIADWKARPDAEEVSSGWRDF